MKKMPVLLFIISFILILAYCIACIALKNTNSSETVKMIFGFGDIANTAIGALLGFGASMLLEAYIIKLNKEKAIVNIVAEMVQIINMINGIFVVHVHNPIEDTEENQRIIKEYLNTFQNGENFRQNENGVLQLFCQRINGRKYAVYLPIWDSVLQSGDLLFFKKQPYFESLIRTYTYINKIRNLIDSFTTAGMSDSENYNNVRTIYMETVQLSSSLDEPIKTLIKSISKGDNQLKTQSEILFDSLIIEQEEEK